jgi:hypothetical protein
MDRREWRRTCGTNKYLCVEKKRIFVYKYDSFVGFIGDALVEAQEYYGVGP